ncbi:MULTISPECIES: CRISPR-associated endoribonuclease Cas6 [unclassified Methanosarcina]|uniref:CRISPR-associated endoribonuclease Cas6 n=1 Tax=unclassified Methanosarcina TaxID=2644672 RepID=UPI0006161207|nr:CRISPR-associated endoribonuclease Cas6 [Methanosarcina sp. WWM596]AKB19486.1 CRISPR repeat RNA endoribonuclease Cas6 [Methanosarcina sp. WWM596]AKB22694.1 CRISPR repeat RNA endoribonuclease Cas6 [Methanosarcina sp. WH1]
MRCRVSVRKISSGPLHYDYQYGLASMLYLKLAASNIDLADKTHSKKGFKFYTFSNLILDDRIPEKSGLNFRKAHFFLSSPDPEFIRSFAEGLLLEPEFFLGNGENKASFIIERIEVLPAVHFSDTCTFRTLSPIYLKTLRKQEERLVEFDLYPKDSKFHENLHKNLVARYEEFYGSKIEKDFFEVMSIPNFKPKRVKVGDNYRRCSLMDLSLSANSELLEFAYDAGLGEKNAMGFGCVGILK